MAWGCWGVLQSHASGAPPPSATGCEQEPPLCVPAACARTLLSDSLAVLLLQATVRGRGCAPQLGGDGEQTSACSMHCSTDCVCPAAQLRTTPPVSVAGFT
jgi:hypothetical protein